MNKFKKTLPLLIATLSLTAVSATSRDLSLAVEDAARATVQSLSQDQRVKGIKSIAFVKLNLPEGEGALELKSNESQVFEAAMASTAAAFTFVTHDTHKEKWDLITKIFDKASSFQPSADSKDVGTVALDPKTLPEIKKLKLADALLIGQVIDCLTEERKDEEETSIRIALRLIKISTGEQIWGKVINGKKINKIVKEERDIKKELTEDAKSLVTFKNILYAIGGLIALLFIFVLVGRMTRVR